MARKNIKARQCQKLMSPIEQLHLSNLACEMQLQTHYRRDPGLQKKRSWMIVFTG